MFTALTIPLLHHSLCLCDKLALCTTTCPWHYWAFYQRVCVHASQFTHPLGPGLCPWVKRQSLLGGFCCEENRRCNMNCMFHCKNNKPFLSCNLWFKRCSFVAYTCVWLCMSACLFGMLKTFSVFQWRLAKIYRWQQIFVCSGIYVVPKAQEHIVLQRSARTHTQSNKHTN